MRSRLPLGRPGPNHWYLSGQMVKSPRAFNAALYAFQFMVRSCLRYQRNSLIWQAYTPES